MNANLYRQAVELISDCDIPPHLSGFNFLSEAVAMKSENYSIKLMDIYNILANNHHCTHRAIRRSIAYAISKSEHICDYLSMGLNETFNGRVIATLALRLTSMSQNR